MEEHEVESYHILFYIATILVFYLIDSFILNQPKIMFSDYLLYGIVILLIPLLLFVVFGLILMIFIPERKIRNPLGSGDVYLTTAAIATTFLVDDFIVLLKNPLLIVLGIIIAYFILYKIISKFNFLDLLMRSG
jgi:hypothetical protein